MSIKNTAKEIIIRTPFRFFAVNMVRYLKHKSKREVKTICLHGANYLPRIIARSNFVIARDSRFVYSIDEALQPISFYPIINNFPLLYEPIIDGSLRDLANESTGAMKKTALWLIGYAEEIAQKLTLAGDKRAIWFSNMAQSSAQTLEEALQRILFINQILWQSGHTLCGLGRLDKTLDRFCDGMDYDGAYTIIKDFCATLHNHYHYKSAALMGDTGQIIILGGVDSNKVYFSNTFTNIFLKVIADLKLPDPKILLRVSSKTPDRILRLALVALKSGANSPLFSNDDVIIPKMIEFGYDAEDAYRYSVSACWEPLVAGIALDSNNMASLNYVQPLIKSMIGLDKNTLDEDEFENLLVDYKRNLIAEAKRTGQLLDMVRFRKDPFVSLFYRECRKSGKDISDWGAKYNNFGVTAVGMPNLINSLMALKGESYRFGDDETLDLVNGITEIVSGYYAARKNRFPGKIKFGLSSPSYINAGKNTPATPDARKAGDPFHTHISADGMAWTQLVRFASKLDYSTNRINGNVVDFILTPKFLEDNFEKFLDFMKTAIRMGFFQMQMNVVDYDTLVAAKKNPDKFKSLIVRVWGFCAYFVELPEEYQDLLIKRSKAAEAA